MASSLSNALIFLLIISTNLCHSPRRAPSSPGTTHLVKLVSPDSYGLEVYPSSRRRFRASSIRNSKRRRRSACRGHGVLQSRGQLGQAP